MSVNSILHKPPGYAGTGSPSKLTPDIQTTICDYISKGNYLVTACHAAGVADATFYNWIERGKAEADAGNTTGIYFVFLDAVKRAEAQCEARWVQQVEAHTNRNVVAPLALLDRRFRERWGQTPQVQAGNTYNINVEKALIDAAGKFDAVVARLAERVPLAIPESTVIPNSNLNEESDNAIK